MPQQDFFIARANEARAEAEKTQLVNVRERALRAAAAWDAMADREERTTKARLQREADKAADAADAVQAAEEAQAA